MKKDIYSKIAEISNRSNVELKSEKVELKSLDSLKSISKWSDTVETDIDKLTDKQQESYSKFKDASAMLVTAGNAREKELSKIETDIKEFEKKAKELGVKPSSFKEYNDALSGYKRASSSIKIAKDLGKIKNPF